ncbi:hypothetical protein AGLY_014224 [Aphis glycines]|uniref:Uncharacterized protein n=1 Tax=Aphis glycines TaxID=307491 RepID=A0A6G0T5Z8_APHGL|nr:hypothetical protein AGLY_014224 [Aphis glycines]
MASMLFKVNATFIRKKYSLLKKKHLNTFCVILSEKKSFANIHDFDEFLSKFELQMLIKKNCAYLSINSPKKTQNILKIKSCKENANLNNWINRYRYAISYKHKTFYDYSTSKLLVNFRVFDRFPTIRTTHKEPSIKFSSFFGHPKLFYRHFKNKSHKNRKFQRSINNSKKFLNKNHIKKSIRSKTGFAKCLLFTSIMHQSYSLFHRKPPPKFEIEALFRLVMT